MLFFEKMSISLTSEKWKFSWLNSTQFEYLVVSHVKVLVAEMTCNVSSVNRISARSLI